MPIPAWFSLSHLLPDSKPWSEHNKIVVSGPASFWIKSIASSIPAIEPPLVWSAKG
jgi:hypothetical protein